MQRCVIIAIIMASMLSSVCMAAIPRSELALGGVTLFTRFANVRQIYGEPTRTSYDDVNIWGGTSRFYTQFYGNGSFSVTATNRDGVVSARTTENNGIGTPAGIKVGMLAERLLMVYGPADSAYTDDAGNRIEVYDERRTGVGERDSLAFVIKNGKIMEIRLLAGILSI